MLLQQQLCVAGVIWIGKCSSKQVSSFDANVIGSCRLSSFLVVVGTMPTNSLWGAEVEARITRRGAEDQSLGFQRARGTSLASLKL
jgi:hypothetical protein